MSGKQAIDGAKRLNYFSISPERVQLWGIDYQSGPEDPAYNPRNKQPVDMGLVDSIMRIGILEPIGVIKGADDNLRVIFGNQRVRAAREANKRLAEMGRDLVEVPCLSPLRGYSVDELSEAAVAENEHRKESNALVKCEMAGVHLKRKNGNIAEAAKAFNLGEQQFKNLLLLKESAAEVKAAVLSGKLSSTAAIEIASLSHDKQIAALTTVVAAGGTVDSAKTTVKKAKGKSSKGKPTSQQMKAILAAKNDTVGNDLKFDEGFRAALAWVVGDIPAKNVKGLSGLLDND